jgi:hypothetical protein
MSLNKYEIATVHVVNFSVGGRAGNFFYTLYVTIRLSIKASNRPARTTNCSQVSLPQEPWMRSDLGRTLLGAWRTDVLTLANKALDLLVQGR